MIDFPAALKAVGGAHTGIAPVNLLDVEDTNGNFYNWADRAIVAPAVMATPVAPALGLCGLCGAFTDADGIAIQPLALGDGPTELTIPAGAAQLQLGVDDDNFSDNTGSFVIAISVNGGSASDVTVAGTAMPWSPTANPSLAFGVNNGTSPVIGASGLVEGQTISISYVSGTVKAGHDFGAFDANGIPGSPTGYSRGSTGTFFPTFYMSTAPASVRYSPWLLSAPAFTFNRSLQTDMGNFEIQNLSGDTLARDFEKIVRRSALEGAFFVYRLWEPAAQAAWLEVHGTLTVDDIGVDTASLKGVQAINPAQDDTPLEEFSETCQINWGLARCGSTQPTECRYSFQSCQVVERFFGVLNSYEKNYGDTEANIPTQVINRTRKV